MGLALGWIAIALAGLAGAPKSEREVVPIQYTVRFVETEGLGWREAVFTRLTPVTRQGSATVWTVPGDVRSRLLQSALEKQGSPVVQTPVIKAWSGSPVHFSIRKNQQLITQVAWDGNDRPETGKPETVRTGPVGTMTGRQLDQGVLVQLVLEDTEVRAIHHLNLTRSAEHTSQATPAAADVNPHVFIGHGKAAGLTAYAYPIPNPAPASCPMAEGLEGLTDVKMKVGQAPGCLEFLEGLPAGRYLHESLPFLAIPVTEGMQPQGTITEIRFMGNSKIPAEKLEAKLLSRAGQPIDAQKIRADLETLMHTRWFSDVQAYYALFGGGKTILFLEFHEMPRPAHRDPAEKTVQTASSTTKSIGSTDCACRKDEVTQAHLERISPAPECCTGPTTSAVCAKADQAHPVAIEVPEIASQEIAGEWLIPKDGILLVSFGPHTVAGPDGKAVIRERLAMIEAESVADGAVQRASRIASYGPSPQPVVPPVIAAPRTIPAPAVVPNLPTAVPVPPSRSIPQGSHPDGRPADLPPLPAEEIEAPHASDSADPTPSPQIKKPQQPAHPASDSQMKKTGYLTSPTGPVIPSVFAATPNIGLQFLVPIKPISFQLPFNRRLEIEIFGRVVPNPKPIENHESEE